MKRFVFFFVLMITCASVSVSAQSLRAEFAMAEFDSPNDGQYLETYLKLKGNSLKQIESEKGSYSEVLITYHVSNGIWVPFKDTYKVQGPLNKQGELALDFIDQRRIPLKVGNYDMEITIVDVHDSLATPAKIQQKVEIERKGILVADKDENLDIVNGTDDSYVKPVENDHSVSQVSGSANAPVSAFKTSYLFSDIQLVDTYTKTREPNILSKAGFDLIPYTSNYYPQEKNELTFYVEIYDTDRFFQSRDYDRITNRTGDNEEAGSANKGDEFLVNIFIENADNGKTVSGLRKFFKRKFAQVVPVLHTVPIDQLPTGNYNLVVEVRDRNNTLLDRRLSFFQRFNNIVSEVDPSLEEVGETNELYETFVTKYQNLDDLKEFLLCLHPISTQEEITQVNQRMNFRDRNMMWQFMYTFWNLRAPENPEAAWETYWQEVLKVNATYTTNLNKGYNTDRGRVYLQYGPPNTISPNYFEPNTYPYEIWHYYQLQDHLNAEQSNRKFIFANTEQGSKEFDLIHSDAKNEITNRRWHHDIHNRSSMSIDLDQEDSGDHYGGRSKQFFDNPY